MSTSGGNWAVRAADWMQRNNARHIKYPRLHLFLLWVCSPRNYGEHLGLKNWLRWASR